MIFYKTVEVHLVVSEKSGFRVMRKERFPMQPCRFCGTQPPDEARFCWRCGRSLTSVAEGAANTVSSSPLTSSAMMPDTSPSAGSNTDGKKEDERQKTPPVLPFSPPPATGEIPAI